MSKTKLGIRFQEYEILYYYSAGKKNALHKKVIFGPKKCFFSFSCLKMVFNELMLLELGDLLELPLLGDFFSAGRSLFSCKYFSKIAQNFQFF